MERTEKYEIIYNYTDESGYESRNIHETFEGDWNKMREHVKSLREDGCYNIDVALIEDFHEE